MRCTDNFVCIVEDGCEFASARKEEFPVGFVNYISHMMILIGGNLQK